MKKYLSKLIDGELLTRQETHNIMLGIVSEKYNECQISALLMALQTRGVTVDELLGFRDGLLETGKRVNLERLQHARYCRNRRRRKKYVQYLHLFGFRCGWSRLSGFKARQRSIHIRIGRFERSAGSRREVYR